MGAARTIAPSTTDETVVLGAFPNGAAALVTSWPEFEARFGVSRAPAHLAVWQFFLNGGKRAWVAPMDPALSAVPERFDLLLMPEVATLPDADQHALIGAARDLCTSRRAFLIVDPPLLSSGVGTPAGVAALRAWANPILGPAADAAAVYYPWLEVDDPWEPGTTRLVPPSGSVAGAYGVRDATRGVWKAPTGTDVPLAGVRAPADPTLTDAVQGELNPLAINCLRHFPEHGTVAFGARTAAGAQTVASPFKYVPVRRTANFIEHSLGEGLGWAAFEPNAAPLWAAVVDAVSDFMAGLFAAGAFAGSTAKDAFFVRCGPSTTTAADLEAGILIVEVGFAPSRPAEFVIVRVRLATATGDG